MAFAQRQRVRTAVQRHVRLDGDQLAIQRQARQRGAQVVADLALDLIGPVDDRGQRAVFAQPLGGGLGPAFLDAGHVVHRVAHQGEEVDDLLGAHAEFLDHGVDGVQTAAAHRVDQRHARPHQLGEILVTGGDGDLHALRRALQRQRADHVVGLHPLHAQQRESQRLHDADHRFDLRAQVLGHGRPVRLVVGIECVAEGRAAGVQHEGHVVRLFLQRGAQHVDHAEQGTGRLALRVGERGQRMECAEQVAGAVDQYESCHAGILRRTPGHGVTRAVPASGA